MTPQHHMRSLALVLLPAFAGPTGMASAGYFTFLVLLGAMASLVAWKSRKALGRDYIRLIVGMVATSALGLVSFLAWGVPAPTPVLVIQLLWLAYVVRVSAKLIYTSIETRIDAGN
jgi:hypothetical protein